MAGSGRGPWYEGAIRGVRLLTRLLRHEWHHLERIPRTGPVVVAANHLSVADPLVLAAVVDARGRTARFLAKEEVFALPVLGRVLRGAGQIPVRRDSADASAALDAARVSLEEGHCVVVYPEGTTTRDPACWPMRARTGVARLALESGAPVVPVAMWGVHDLAGQVRRGRGRGRRPRVLVAVGEPVDLTPWRGRALTAAVLHGASEAVMDGVRSQLVTLRGGTPPAVPLDPRLVRPVRPGRGAPRRSA